jgi:hypothetical protein
MLPPLPVVVVAVTSETSEQTLDSPRSSSYLPQAALVLSPALLPVPDEPAAEHQLYSTCACSLLSCTRLQGHAGARSLHSCSV